MANGPDNRVAPGQRHDLGQLLGSLFGQAQPNPAQGMANMNTATPMADPVLPMGQQELPYSNFTYDEALRDWDQGRFGAFMNQAGARLGPDAGYNETSALAEQLAEAARQERDFNFQQSDIQGGRGNIIPETDPATDPIDAVGLLTGTPSQDVGQTMVGGMVPTRGDGTQRKRDVQRVINAAPDTLSETDGSRGATTYTTYMDFSGLPEDIVRDYGARVHGVTDETESVGIDKLTSDMDAVPKSVQDQRDIDRLRGQYERGVGGDVPQVNPNLFRTILNWLMSSKQPQSDHPMVENAALRQDYRRAGPSRAAPF